MLRPLGESKEMSVGARIRDEREAQKMSQAQLAKQVGLSSAAIWNWETKGRVPRPQVLAKVAEVLSVSEEYLAEGRNGAVSPTETKKIIQTPEQAAPAQSSDQRATVAELLQRTRVRIAELTGFSPDQIKLTLTTTF
jgi:transcriptional regulator with XRE-family HTH domain